MLSLRDSINLMGFECDIDEKVLRKRYGELSKKYHPDINGGDTETMAKINEAREVLRDAIKANGVIRISEGMQAVKESVYEKKPTLIISLADAIKMEYGATIEFKGNNKIISVNKLNIKEYQAVLKEEIKIVIVNENKCIEFLTNIVAPFTGARKIKCNKLVLKDHWKGERCRITIELLNLKKEVTTACNLISLSFDFKDFEINVEVLRDSVTDENE